jgi:hypothetical protein
MWNGISINKTYLDRIARLDLQPVQHHAGATNLDRFEFNKGEAPFVINVHGQDRIIAVVVSGYGRRRAPIDGCTDRFTKPVVNFRFRHAQRQVAHVQTAGMTGLVLPIERGIAHEFIGAAAVVDTAANVKFGRTLHPPLPSVGQPLLLLFVATKGDW